MARLFLAALAALTASAVSASEPLPPATVLVTFDRGNIRTVLAEGLADRATGRAVTADDPVRVASISKLVTALGVKRLVDQGKLDLNRDVSDYLGWRLRNPAFPDQSITLNMLLSHRSSLIDGDDLYIIPLGETLQQRLADPRVWDTAHAPGSDWFHYTNLNFPVVASVMERVTNQRFDRLMHRLVLKPLKLDACFNWGEGCSKRAYSRVVVLYRASGEVARDDLHGQPPPCPVLVREGVACDLSSYRPGDNGALFSPQGGLRISMRDLAKLGQMLVRGLDSSFLRQPSVTLIHEPWRFNGRNGVGEDGTASGFFCEYGLAMQHLATRQADCRDDPFGDGIVRFGHAGEAYGLRSGLWYDPWTRKGVAYFTSAVPDDAPTGQSAFTAREEALLRRIPR